ncbi:R3H domain-containing nucleic acid-binding protein [Dielma fastidiosa]|uniref:R3H domain-containing nucleic acid-binding protein n=1 Tax=Dielma fastidiosa TaxID=1034346 RepID=UPI00356AC15F
MDTYTGKNLEEALKIAADKKGCMVDELTYTVVEEKAGIFGIGSKVTVSAYCDNDIRQFIINYLDNYFKGIHMEVEVECVKDDYQYKVQLNAENNAILIGKNGQTLQDINTVVKAAASSEFKKKVMVLTDINGYKENKYVKECSAALRIAKTVQKTKVDAVLDPMPNDERKAIHTYLANMPRIRTISEGEGKDRRLKIVYDANKR